MNKEEYNQMIDNFKNNMSKIQQQSFLLDVLDMEYSKPLRMRFIKVLTK